MAARNESKASVFFIGIIQRSEATDGIVGIQFAVSVVLVPGKDVLGAGLLVNRLIPIESNIRTQ